MTGSSNNEATALSISEKYTPQNLTTEQLDFAKKYISNNPVIRYINFIDAFQSEGIKKPAPSTLSAFLKNNNFVQTKVRTNQLGYPSQLTYWGKK